jgi:serine/threonine protein kinase
VVAARLFEPEKGRQRVDRYELIGEIASGGMATVFLARLTGVGGFQRFVAIKRLHPHLAGEAEFVEMFLDEARLAAGIHHPNVVPILEVHANPVGYYLVMEYIEGDTLARLLARSASKGQRLPVPIVLRILLDTLAGLHAAHELRDDHGAPVNLVHRDVSPQNVLVGSDGVARITDFGVARAASRLTATRVGQLKGKIAYMAPEQASGVEEIDRRADVFSAGIVAWEALAARRLFKAENEAATLSRVMSEPVKPLHEAVPTISKELSAAVARALERDRDSRYASCAQFADAVEAAAQGRDGIASARELAAYVREVMGQEIEQQREAVRTWLARSEPSQVDPLSLVAAPSSSVSAAAMSIPGEDASKNLTRPTLSSHAGEPRSRVPLVLGGLLLLGLLGAGGFFVVRSSQEGTAQLGAAAPPVETVAPAPPPAETVTSPPAPAESSAPASSAAEPAPSALPAASTVPAAPAAHAPPSRAHKAKSSQKKSKDADTIKNPYR